MGALLMNNIKGAEFRKIRNKTMAHPFDVGAGQWVQVASEAVVDQAENDQRPLWGVSAAASHEPRVVSVAGKDLVAAGLHG